MPDELVDLSLFATSPTVDRQFTLPCMLTQHEPKPNTQPHPLRNFSRPVDRDCLQKPLPPLPHRSLIPRSRRTSPKNSDQGPGGLLTRLRKTRSSERPNPSDDTLPHRRDPTPLSPQQGLSAYQENSLLRRRNPTSTPPQLTLSVPESNPRIRSPASAMVWMPEEQMWLIAGEMHPDVVSSPETFGSPPAYTPADTQASPYPYSPSSFTRSEPSPTLRPLQTTTPPLTPIQVQLRRLIENREERPRDVRDEERFSPLFQEAMNSVPMEDPNDISIPPAYHELPQILRPQTARSPAWKPQTLRSPQFPKIEASAIQNRPSRSVSTGSETSHPRTISPDSRSFHSAVEDASRDRNAATRSWVGFARRVAMPATP